MNDSLLILASASPRRSQLLTQVGLTFDVLPSTFAEFNGRDLPPKQVALENARGKARQVAKNLREGLVLAADTIVVNGETVLGKPRDRADAKRMLQLLSGGWHKVITAVVLVRAEDGREIADAVTTKVHMRPICQDELADYLDSEEPYDKAGAYGIQGLAAKFVDRIEGCYFNVVGLPLSRTTELIRIMQG
jgi:septum formation protein